MFESSIHLQGGAFEKITPLKDILAKRMNIVFGRNGSGKSTIARAFREQQPDYQLKHSGRLFQLSFDDKSGTLPIDVRERLFVFNEDFIDDNVKFSDGGLKSIIRIGASAELAGPIEEAKEKINELQKQLKPRKDEYDLLNGKGEKSIAAADKKFKDGLKAPGGYLDRLKTIENIQKLTANLATAVQNAPVADDKPFALVEEAKALDTAIARYRSYQEGAVICWQTPDLTGRLDLDAINGLLNQAVRPAAPSDQEKAIFDDVCNALAYENFIPKTQALIVEGRRDYCPLCHQPVSAEHKHLLEQRIIRFRDKQVEEFQRKVALMLESITTFPDTIPEIPAPEYQEDLDNARDSIHRLNAFIADIRQALERKQTNPFSPMPVIDVSEWEALLSAGRDAFAKVSEDVNAYNQKLQEKEKLLDAIKKKNILLAAHENRALIQVLKQKTERKASLETEMAALQSNIQQQKRKLETLQGQLDQIDDAREQINTYLDIIFGEKKLRLANATKDSYKLQLRNGSAYIDIPTRSISSGERNALALAYFFACVLEKKDKDYDYGEPTLLVIDDPVSSFDAENKAGVISLLALQCKRVLQGNPDSKILIFTHDFTTLRELCDQRARFFSGEDGQTETYLLLKQNHNLLWAKSANIRDNMAYYSDLTSIFRFANMDDPEEFETFDSIGNTLRSFAESYASHMFKCKWMDLFSDPDRMACLPLAIRSKIQAFAIRPVLNSESHGVTSAYEPAEIQRAAKILLVYLYYSNYEHLAAYLVGRKKTEDSWKMKKIEGWGWEF